MIEREAVAELVNRQIEGTGLFMVDVSVSGSNYIRVLVDSHEGITIKECGDLSKAIEEGLDRDEQDFQLEVSSPGLSESLKVLPQYVKNIGRDVEVNTLEGKKHEGKLIRLTDKGFVIEELVKVRGEKKRPGIKTIETEFNFDLIRSVKVLLSYK